MSEQWLQLVQSMLRQQWFMKTADLDICIQLVVLIVVEPWLISYLRVHRKFEELLIDCAYVDFFYYFIENLGIIRRSFIRLVVERRTETLVDTSPALFTLANDHYSQSRRNRTTMLDACVYTSPCVDEIETILGELIEANAWLHAGYLIKLMRSGKTLMAVNFPSAQNGCVNDALFRVYGFLSALLIPPAGPSADESVKYPEWLLVPRTRSFETTLVCTKNWWHLIQATQMVLSHYRWYRRRDSCIDSLPRPMHYAYWWGTGSFAMRMLVLMAIAWSIVDVSPAQMVRLVAKFQFTPADYHPYMIFEHLLAHLNTADFLRYHHLPNCENSSVHAVLSIIFQQAPHYMRRKTAGKLFRLMCDNSNVKKSFSLVLGWLRRVHDMEFSIQSTECAPDTALNHDMDETYPVEMDEETDGWSSSDECEGTPGPFVDAHIYNPDFAFIPPDTLAGIYQLCHTKYIDSATARCLLESCMIGYQFASTRRARTGPAAPLDENGWYQEPFDYMNTSAISCELSIFFHLVDHMRGSRDLTDDGLFLGELPVFRSIQEFPLVPSWFLVNTRQYNDGRPVLPVYTFESMKMWHTYSSVIYELQQSIARQHKAHTDADHLCPLFCPPERMTRSSSIDFHIRVYTKPEDA